MKFLPSYLEYLRITDENSNDYFGKIISRPYSSSNSNFLDEYDVDEVVASAPQLTNKVKTPTFKNDLTEKEFGRLTVIGFDKEMSQRIGRSCWVCKCKCGNIKSICGKDLISGNTKSCGCNQSFNKYDLSSKEYGIGYTKKGIMFLFDKEDYSLISQYLWTNSQKGYIVSNYRDENGRKHQIKMHRLVMGITDPNIIIDHIHHNRTDNRKSELRTVTSQENAFNRGVRKDNTSGYTGVQFNPRINKWISQISINGKTISIGCFVNKDDAINARKKAEKEYFGEYRYQDNECN